ncbi:MAG TPA: diacylglycerol kinase family protein [Streptosporangiaceae bacterium]
MRALLIVNPRATSTTEGRREVIARALASSLDLEVVQTRYRGHASNVAAHAAKEGYDLVLTLGGDGTVNEAVNGLLRGRDGMQPPLLAVLPGGNANVFTRALGLAADPVDATGEILAALARGSSRPVGLGLADGRYFCINAGLGLDAEVVRVVEGLRARGRTATPALYLTTTVRHFWSVTDRRHPALTVERPGQPDLPGLYCGIVSNTTPWTYLGQRPVNPSPQASFGTGLDLFGLRKLSTVGTLNAVRQMLPGDGRPPRGRHVVTLHDEAAFSFRASRPMAFQLDGEYVGERERVTFHAIPNALRVIA